MNRRDFIGGCAALGAGAVAPKRDCAKPLMVKASLVRNRVGKPLATRYRITPMSSEELVRLFGPRVRNAGEKT